MRQALRGLARLLTQIQQLPNTPLHLTAPGFELRSPSATLSLGRQLNVNALGRPITVRSVLRWSTIEAPRHDPHTDRTLGSRETLPISCTPSILVHDVQVTEWTVTDVDLLADQITTILTGRYRHLLLALQGTPLSGTTTDAQARSKISALMQQASGPKLYHRDGLLFQTISWLSLAKSSGVYSHLYPPQTSTAQPGTDNLAISYDSSTKTLNWVMICEAKAVGDPKKVADNEVYPDFAKTLSGDRSQELVPKVSSLLDQVVNFKEATEIAEAVFWKEDSRFRLAYAADLSSNKFLPDSVFKGFPKAIPGAAHLRHGSVFATPGFRSWFQTLATKVLTVCNRP